MWYRGRALPPPGPPSCAFCALKLKPLAEFHVLPGDTSPPAPAPRDASALAAPMAQTAGRLGGGPAQAPPGKRRGLLPSRSMGSMGSMEVEDASRVLRWSRAAGAAIVAYLLLSSAPVLVLEWSEMYACSRRIMGFISANEVYTPPPLSAAGYLHGFARTEGDLGRVHSGLKRLYGQVAANVSFVVASEVLDRDVAIDNHAEEGADAGGYEMLTEGVGMTMKSSVIAFGRKGWFTRWFYAHAAICATALGLYGAAPTGRARQRVSYLLLYAAIVSQVLLLFVGVRLSTINGLFGDAAEIVHNTEVRLAELIVRPPLRFACSGRGPGCFLLRSVRRLTTLETAGAVRAAHVLALRKARVFSNYWLGNIFGAELVIPVTHNSLVVSASFLIQQGVTMLVALGFTFARNLFAEDAVTVVYWASLLGVTTFVLQVLID